jgi:hypothetical protein
LANAPTSSSPTYRWTGVTRSTSSWTNSLRNHAASLRDLPIAAIETKDVLAVIEPIWRAKPITAHTERAYQRGDLLNKRRRLMEQWSAFCRSKPSRSKSSNVPAGNVLSLRRVAK